MAPIFELPLTVPPRGDRLRALHRQLRAAILEGRLQPGLRLPPTRRGAGTFVTDVLPKLKDRATSRPSAASDDRRLHAFWRANANAADVVPEIRPAVNFAMGVPDISHFPMDVWRRVLLDGLEKEFKPWLTPIPAAAGLHLSPLATRSLDVESFVTRAKRVASASVLSAASRSASRDRRASYSDTARSC